jgi:hypothetical protein
VGRKHVFRAYAARAMRPLLPPLVLGLTFLACSGNGSDELSEELGSDAGIDSGSSLADDDAGEPDAGHALDASASDAGAFDAGDGLDASASDAGAGLDASTSDASAGLDASASDASAGLDASASEPDAGAITTTVMDLDFESDLPPGVDPGAGTLTPSEGFATLGTAENTFGATFLRSPTSSTVTVTISSLPIHSSLDLDFLFAAIDSLDGEGAFPAGDHFRVDLDGVTVFRETFANALPEQVQTYVPPAGVTLARRVDLGFGGPGGYFTDSAYDMGQDPAFHGFSHSAARAVLTFTLEGDGVQDLSDESWGIDNLRVRVGNSPRAPTDAGVGVTD